MLDAGEISFVLLIFSALGLQHDLKVHISATDLECLWFPRIDYALYMKFV